ncbi:C39 family peptidase [Numidum massiliense]|uniref:C39 family peptidase n=1 Tax=Numidum massiliense TaxID=1522315 RepID=UPI0006D532F5
MKKFMRRLIIIVVILGLVYFVFYKKYPLFNTSHGDLFKNYQEPLDVAFVQQMPELPRGCEVTSLAMLLNHAGVDVDKMTLSEEIHKVPFEKDGKRGNMNKGFVGDMYSFETPGIGVYADPIYELGNRYLPGQLVNLSGKDISDIYQKIDRGIPVWIIINATYKPLANSEFQTWHTTNGDMKITYHMHSAVITGYDTDHVYLNDPLADKANKKVDRKNFEKAWKQMGSQAISLED